MSRFKIGDVVRRKSYGGDLSFIISDVIEKEGKTSYILKGILYRLIADSDEDELEKQNTLSAYWNMRRSIIAAERIAFRESRLRGMRGLRWGRARAGKILHLDGSEEYLGICMQHYKGAKIDAIGKAVPESDQPEVVKNLLRQYKPDILVLTGHDSMKKNADKNLLYSYSNSKYFIQAVKEARRYEPSFDKLCIFAGACQSYYEAIMEAGANFASSPGRILIYSLDPSFVSERVATTNENMIVTPQEAASVTISGSDGIGGISTKGHLKTE